MIQDRIHEKIVQNCEEVCSWFDRLSEELPFPFYSSFDIRDSGFKLGPVDANIFPAGFNNICQQDKESSEALVKTYMETAYPEARHVLILTEEHTKNAYYWENVHTIMQLLSKAGYDTCVSFPGERTEPIEVESISGFKITIHPTEKNGKDLIVNGMKVDAVISNNDFSQNYSGWLEGLSVPMNPPHDLGWHRRKKSDFFMVYNQLAEEFSRLLDVPSACVTVKTERFNHFDISDEQSRDELAQKTDQFITVLQREYQDLGIETKPFVFIKNNSGTYGLGVLKAESGDDIRGWNYKSKKTMKAVKGGGTISEVIIQEGVPTHIMDAESAAEPVIYMVGNQLAGGFLRTHNKKGPEGNLNSPGAVYKKLCISDLSVDTEGCPMENVYGWLARLGVMAIAREAHRSNIVIR